ncbi:SRPBCC family protein [Streptomyces sp. NBC_01497]|uniref:SRPBCC family protein n=1 Tax=Streptomyces sp. NBC_01497 TaxID=2903885 RepID=UPI002E381447|nr:SRPBCC family protein [Streptomyces sp. NBC_01497]
MSERPSAGQRSNEIESTATIDRPVAPIFAFYRDFRNLPLFLGDVMSVEPTGDATSRWTIQGPMRVRIHWTVEVVEERENASIRYRTASPRGLQTIWDISFTPEDRADGTKVREVMTLPLGKFAQAGLSLIGKPPADEIAANLNRLKQLMETGKVTDLRHAVPGKFVSPVPPSL